MLDLNICALYYLSRILAKLRCFYYVRAVIAPDVVLETGPRNLVNLCPHQFQVVSGIEPEARQKLDQECCAGSTRTGYDDMFPRGHDFF